MSAPPVVVFTREPLPIEEIAKLVVVAPEVVALRAVKLPKVEDALVRMPPERVASPVTPSVLESVADWSVARPLAVRVENVAPLVALKVPPMVEDAEEKKLVLVAPPLKVAAPVTESVLESVADWSVAAPLAVSVLNVAPLVALSCEPTVVEPVVVSVESVEAPETASVLREERPETLSEVEVAFVVVPLITERLDIEEEALMMMPTVVVGDSAPLTSSKVLPNGEEPGVA